MWEMAWTAGLTCCLATSLKLHEPAGEGKSSKPALRAIGSIKRTQAQQDPNLTGPVLIILKAK